MKQKQNFGINTNRTLGNSASANLLIQNNSCLKSSFLFEIKILVYLVSDFYIKKSHYLKIMLIRFTMLKFI